MDTVLRHPGEAKVTTTRATDTVRPEYEVWISDGEIVRTYASAHGLGTQRPVRNRPRGLDDPDLPGTSKVYEPVTALPMETLPDTFVHPAGYCQNVLATGRCLVSGTAIVAGREAITLECDHPRTTELPGDRPDFHISIAVDRDTGVILRLVESIGGERHPPRRGHRAPAGRPAPALGLLLRLPHRDDDALLSPGSSEACGPARIIRPSADRSERRASRRIPRAADAAPAAAQAASHPASSRTSPRYACGAPSGPQPPLSTGLEGVRTLGRQTGGGDPSEGGTDDPGHPAKTPSIRTSPTCTSSAMRRSCTARWAASATSRSASASSAS